MFRRLLVYFFAWFSSLVDRGLISYPLTTRAPMATPITLKDITIYPVVEQQGTVLQGARVLPDAEQGAVRGKPLLACAGIHRRLRRRRALHPGLCHQDTAPQHPDRCLRRQSQAAADASGLEHDEQRPLREGACRHGLTVNDIDYVMCTHLHGDHVGWNTRLDNGRWVPTFPKAKYIMADRELAHWTAREKENPGQRSMDHRFGAADHRRQARADRQKRFCL